MNEQDALLVLNAVPGIGNATIHKLLKRYGSAIKVLSLNEADIFQGPGISPKAVSNILNFKSSQFLKAEYDRIEQRNVHVVTWLDEDYPQALREIVDAPMVLYVKGNLSSGDALPMAIVGSRRATLYGAATSEKFAARLAEFGFTIVSGMARGIDTTAHKGALRAGGPTVAVLGCGLSHIYPSENKKLSEEISKTGAVISEFPMETAPLAYNFPRRNRIISGLSLGVIVVEAARKSGALITADFALEQGREVFAVPGKIDHPSSQGVHGLIKQGAKLITCIEDVLEDIRPRIEAYLKHGRDGSPGSQRPSAPEGRSRGTGDWSAGDQLRKLSPEEQTIFNCITDRPVHIDELTRACDETVPVMSVLLQLELKHLIKQLPGKLFVNKT